MTDDASELTLLFERIRGGSESARDVLFTLVYRELHAIAARIGRGHQSLQTTELVNEAYLKLVRGEGRALREDRRFFFGAAARAMRQVIVDHCRNWREPRSTGTPAEALLDRPAHRGEALEAAEELELLDKALDALAARDPDLSEIVELRFYAGLTIAQVAELLDIGTATVERRTRVARGFLYDWMTEKTEP